MFYPQFSGSPPVGLPLYSDDNIGYDLLQALEKKRKLKVKKAADHQMAPAKRLEVLSQGFRRPHSSASISHSAGSQF